METQAAIEYLESKGFTGDRSTAITIIGEARNWVLDCEGTWMEDSDDLLDLTDLQIVQGVHRHFDGGIEEFLLCM